MGESTIEPRNKEREQMSRIVIILFAGLWLVASVHAETGYVTDMLQLEMYSTADMAGAPLRNLRSGDKVEVVERNGRVARVKSDDGQEGWVKGLYLVADEPARTRVNQLEQSNKGLENTVKKLRSQLAAEQGALTELEQVQSGTEEQRATTESELENLRSENARLERSLSAYGINVPLTWLFIAMVIAVTGGFAGCWYWIDRRSRDRHGGYRIY
jgi:SH3 domain protein